MKEKRMQNVCDIAAYVFLLIAAVILFYCYYADSLGWWIFDQVISPSQMNRMLVLGIMMLIVHFGMGILNRYPSIFNYPIKLKEEHKASIHIRAQRFLASIRLVTNILFVSLIFLEWYQNKLMLIPIVVVLIFYPIIIISFVRRVKNRNRNY